MEKLEVKHLAPYLPYDIKVKKLKLEQNTIQTLYSASFRGVYFINNRIELYKFNEITPILRPLSEYLHLEFSEEVEEILNNYSIGYVKNNTLRLPYLVIEEFLKNHLDIFNLIEKGLAIDINNLNQ